jgi:hypothetical protein
MPAASPAARVAEPEATEVLPEVEAVPLITVEPEEMVSKVTASMLVEFSFKIWRMPATMASIKAMTSEGVPWRTNLKPM